MRLKTMFLVSLAIVALALATTMTSRAEKPLVISGAAAAEPHDDADHAGDAPLFAGPVGGQHAQDVARLRRGTSVVIGDGQGEIVDHGIM